MTADRKHAIDGWPFISPEKRHSHFNEGCVRVTHDLARIPAILTEELLWGVMSDGQESRQIDLAKEPAFRLGPAEVQPAVRAFIVGDVRETLEPRVMQVLVALARRRGEVVSRDELTDCCWNGRIVGDDAVSRCIAAIRRLATTHGGFSLETIPRVGYRLVEETTAAQGADRLRTEQPKREVLAVRGWITRRWKIATATAMVLLASVVVVFVLLPDRPTHRLQPRLTIAVLPFTPLYEGADGQRLGDAIATSIANVLTGSPWDVVSPTKSLPYRGAAKAGAAQALHADFLIDGDIRQDAGKAVVSLRVIEGSSGTVLIAGTFERPFAEAANLPDDVATQLAQAGTTARGAKRPAGWDPRVMAGYFRATFQFGGRNDLYGANETARSVAKLAPDDPLAQSLHGFTAILLLPALPPERRPAMVTEARQAAERAIQLDPGYSDSYAVLSLATPLIQWDVRERYLRKGLAAFSDSLVVQIHLTELLQNAGRFRESAQLAERVFRYAPYQTRPLIELINARLWVGDAEASRTLIVRGRQLDPSSPWFVAKMFEATAFHGDGAAALMLLRDENVRGRILIPGGSLKTFQTIALALLHRRASDIAAVVQDCGSLEGRTAEVRRTCFMALVALGRLDDAFAAAAVLYPDQRGATEEARRQRWLSTDVSPTAYLSVPVTAPLRADPRYRELVDRVGLLAYWRASGHPPDFCATEQAPVCSQLK